MQNTHNSWTWEPWFSRLYQGNPVKFPFSSAYSERGQSFTCPVYLRLSYVGYSLSNFETCCLVPLFRSTNAYPFEWVGMPSAEYSFGTNKNGYFLQCTDCIQSKADLNKHSACFWTGMQTWRVASWWSKSQVLLWQITSLENGGFCALLNLYFPRFPSFSLHPISLTF